MKMQKYTNIDQYIANFSTVQQKVLQQIRKTITDNAPGAEEKISYGIPTFHLNGPLVHFAAYDTHYAFYPGAKGVMGFPEELKDYDTSKGTIRFPVDKPVPYELIGKITAYRVTQNTSKK